jgi:hypothetical protein
MCTHASHEELRRDRERYEAWTFFVGWQELLDEPALELRNCLGCGSTLADGTRQVEEEDRHAA